MRGCDSRPGLTFLRHLSCGIFLLGRGDGMVDSGDLKSPGRNAVWVRVPSPAPMLHSLWYRLLARFFPTTPLVTVGISKEALLHNFEAYRKAHPDLLLAPVLKSNAYGHDLGLVARALDAYPLAFFMVDSLYEARRLRMIGVRSRILVMGYVRPECIAKARLSRLDFTVTGIQQLREVLLLLKRPARFHIKLDTGMHRQGITEAQLEEATALLKESPYAQVVGVCSHLADADNTDEVFSRAQLEAWKRLVERLEITFPLLEYKHLSATKGVRFAQEAATNVVRLGMGLYGFDTSSRGSVNLEPVLELRSVIASLRTIAAGESVGYSAAYTTDKETLIATVPAGYFEGVDRRLSGKGSVLIREVSCPIVGRVSMNMVSVDVSGVSDVAVGNSVTLISRNSTDSNSLPNLAALVSTDGYRESIYVLLSHLPQHLKRVLE